MTDNPVLDVAIGIMGMFLCLSLVCTVVNELIATILQLRATTLAEGVKKLIDDDALRAAFGAHGLVQSAKAAAGDRQPSYFAGEDFAMALLGSLDPTKPLQTMAEIDTAIGKLPNSNIRDALVAHAAAANGQLDQLRTNVAKWFDQSMDRVSGVYKRKLKVIGFVVGAAVAIAFNADTIRVYKLLWHDSSLRAAAVAHATDVIDPTLSAGQGTSAIIGPPSATSTAAVIPISTTTSASAHPMTVAQLNHIEESLRPLPIGWTASEWATGDDRTVKWITKALGIVVTVLAISLGAPFWFDVLSKVANIRGTGAKPSRTESS